MLDPRLIQEAANRLDAAERSRQQVRQFSLDYPDIAIEDAYAIQRAWVERKIADGRVLKGHKIGLTSRAMQVSSNISEPDYGALLDDMFFEEGSDIPFQRFIVPRVEVELAFILGKPLKGPGCTLFDVLEATEWVIPALEIIDARIQQVDPQTKVTRKVFDTISDNAANAGVVMGGRAVRPGDIDLRRVPAILYRNGVIEESGVSAAVLNHPAKGVAWLANKLAPYGVCLEAGQVILGGSFTRPVAAAPGTPSTSTTTCSAASPAVSSEEAFPWTCPSIASSNACAAARRRSACGSGRSLLRRAGRQRRLRLAAAGRRARAQRPAQPARPVAGAGALPRPAGDPPGAGRHCADRSNCSTSARRPCWYRWSTAPPRPKGWCAPCAIRRRAYAGSAVRWPGLALEQRGGVPEPRRRADVPAGPGGKPGGPGQPRRDRRRRGRRRRVHRSADLSAAMGHRGNPGHPEVQAAIEDAIHRIRTAGKAAGISPTRHWRGATWSWAARSSRWAWTPAC